MYFSVSSFTWMVAIPEIISPQPWKVKDWKFWLRTSAGLLFWNCFNCNVCSTTKYVSPIPISHINLSFLRSDCKLFIRVTPQPCCGFSTGLQNDLYPATRVFGLAEILGFENKMSLIVQRFTFFAHHFEQKKLEFKTIKMFRLLWCLAKTAF